MTSKDFFSEENEVQSSWIKWGKVGDYFIGTLTAKRTVEDQFNAGKTQEVYDFKMKEGSFHNILEDKSVAKDATIVESGELYSVGGKASIDAQMRNVKIGQIVGMKFKESVPSKTKGYNPSKVIKIYTSGEMDDSVLEGVGGEVGGDDDFDGFGQD